MDIRYFGRFAGGLTVMAALAAPVAEASEFTINACQADRAEFSTRAFEDFANRGMMWKRACDPEGPGLRGLVTANVVRAGRVEQGARSYFVLRAPEGTRFARFTWSGQARRHDCRYALQLWAARPDGPSTAIKNVQANRGCPNRGRIQSAGWPSAQTYDIAGATAIVQRVLCVGSSETPYCSARGLNFIRTFKAAATVVDVSPPGVSISQDNAFTRGEWVNGTQQVNYAALDNVGVRLARAVVAGVPYGDSLRACNFALRIPCPNGTGSIAVNTGALNEGSNALTLQAEDAAGNRGDSTAVTVRVDHTAPGAIPLGIDGGEVWRNRNDFDVQWSNPPEGDRAPISAAHYRLCLAGDRECVSEAQSGLGIDRLADLAVPQPGEWYLRLWREDAAGNQEPANASLPVTLRYDPEPPQLGFEAPNPSDPTSVSVLVTDKVSGLGGGEIELSRQGSGVWEVLATQREGSRLTARIDDARFSPGGYILRGTARDQAANQNTTDRRLDGSPALIHLPLRARTVVRAGLVRDGTVTPRRKDRRRRAGRNQSVVLPRARIPFGEEVTLKGRVLTRAGDPIPGAEVQLLARSSNAPEQLRATLQADELGRYTYVTRATATTVLRVSYAGSPTTLPSQREATMLVPAVSTIRARPHAVRNGETVGFAGELRSLPAPLAGKLVELQVVLSGRWQTFRTVRTTASGRWQLQYRFRRSCGLLRYRFRARLPEEVGYPFEVGHTRPVRVRVRGEPCR